MQIGCTKKLQTFLGLTAPAANPAADPFFCWTATLIPVNRRKALVVMNDATHLAFLLYGVTAKEHRSLDRLLLQGIRASLDAEGIDPAISARYMADLGDAPVYTKTANRTVVGFLSTFCIDLPYQDPVFLVDQTLQTHLLRSLNFNVFRQGKERFTPGEALAAEFTRHYGVGNPIRCRAAVLEITLQLPVPCVRQLEIPLSCTFEQLHTALQALFCWQDFHMHDFWLRTDPDGRPKETLVGEPREFEYEGEHTRLDCTVRLADVFPQYKKIFYRYDFGDNWSINITLKKIDENCGFNYPRCLLAIGAAPPEDIGGESGYADFLRIMNDSADPEYKETKSWADEKRWNSEIDIEQINRELEWCLHC